MNPRVKKRGIGPEQLWYMEKVGLHRRKKKVEM
jgi:hypothetical protein